MDLGVECDQRGNSHKSRFQRRSIYSARKLYEHQEVCALHRWDKATYWRASTLDRRRSQRTFSGTVRPTPVGMKRKRKSMLIKFGWKACPRVANNLPRAGDRDVEEREKEARLRMSIRKDLREDAAKGIDKTASLHLLRSRQLTQWQRGQLRAIHMNGVWTCDALHKAGRLACGVCPACGKEPETQDHTWRCQDEQYAVIRRKCTTEKDEEELRKESR